MGPTPQPDERSPQQEQYPKAPHENPETDDWLIKRAGDDTQTDIRAITGDLSDHSHEKAVDPFGPDQAWPYIKSPRGNFFTLLHTVKGKGFNGSREKIQDGLINTLGLQKANITASEFAKQPEVKIREATGLRVNAFNTDVNAYLWTSDNQVLCLKVDYGRAEKNAVIIPNMIPEMM